MIYVDQSSNFHPYECSGPGKCEHCDQIVSDTHDPATCALCQPEGEAAMTEAAPEPTKTAPREYVILQKASGDYWSNVGKVTASSVENAIKKHIAAIDLSSDDQVDGPDPFIAVPARYWKPVTAKIEVKSTVTLS